ncbi:hypothetical protein MNB_SV-4-989 [hydrothermal vent metagenome]|uniref:Uncharacterized protein n=1 Tax=hydrothermal vent metagenome TaxID=652676 RepID=A0A1W1E7S2_9ZZZZ
MKNGYTRLKFITLFLLLGFFSPTVEVNYDLISGISSIDFTLLNSVETRRGGGGMRGGMRGGAMRMRAAGKG